MSKPVKKEKAEEKKPEVKKPEAVKKAEVSKPVAPAVIELPKPKPAKITEPPKPKTIEDQKITEPPKPKAAQESDSDLSEALEILGASTEIKKGAEGPKAVEAPKAAEAPKTAEVVPLDKLSIEAVDGVGPKVGAKLKAININTLEDLMKANPGDVNRRVKIPIHKLMEYQEKAQMILDLKLDDEIINALEAKNYTIEQAVEEDPENLLTVTKLKNKDKIMDFLRQAIQITMFLDAYTCRTSSVGILHRAKKEPAKIEKPLIPIEKTGVTLENLSVGTIDGVGPKIEAKLNQVGIITLDHLARSTPTGIYKAVQLPLHKLLEYKKKAQMILQLELDEKIIDALEAKNYTIAQSIEEDPEVIKTMSGAEREQVLEFLTNVIQITLFLDAATCRTNSVGILHKKKKEAGKPQVELPPPEEIKYLGKEQILAKIYSTELDSAILNLLRERARNKIEIQKALESKLMKCTLSDLNEVIDLLVQTELVQLEWFEGNFDVHLFLISDFAIMRTPAFKIIEEAEKHLPTPDVAKQYLETAGDFFGGYKPNQEDNLVMAKLLRDPDIYVTLSLIRGRIYPLKKFPKGMGESNVDMRSIIDKMAKGGIVKIFTDETKEEWVMLLTDIRVPQFYPEYMMENIRRDSEEKVLTPVLAAKHLDLLEIHYDTFFEIYSKFFRMDEE